MRNTNAFHGSDVEAVEDIYNIKKEDVTNFSSNVNPLGISRKLRETLVEHIDVISSYPDRNYKSLRMAIGEYIHADYQNILVGNGSTELISLIIQMKKPKTALLLGPTYSEYERELSLGGSDIAYYNLKEEDDFELDFRDFKPSINKDIDMLILCNPNNPTSTCLDNHRLIMILELCREFGILVMIDETYVEFVTDVEAVTAVPLTAVYDNLVVLRGVSKFFAAPGLRLGYAVSGNLELLDFINEKKNPWSINSLAEVAGSVMFSDTEYIEKTRILIDDERNFMYESLSRLHKLKVYRPAGNFILVRIADESVTSQDFFEFCIKRGLMIRDCSSFASLKDRFVRFCIMQPEKNKTLLECFEEYFS